MTMPGSGTRFIRLPSRALTVWHAATVLFTAAAALVRLPARWARTGYQLADRGHTEAANEHPTSSLAALGTSGRTT
ncbi:hypothetical protein ACODT5_02640 [Streptomyces sp. 5.8]|uniref:hypothetical protein n=1 Tax=Streptomyces sp. 5.8 TaxID=3406571 RepID=UPI003BB6B191